MGLEEVDANTVRPEVRFEADEDEWGGWAEMEDFGVPLPSNVRSAVTRLEVGHGPG